MTTGQRRPLVAGNWKMNGLAASAAEFGKMTHGAAALSKVDLMVCPPATLLACRRPSRSRCLAPPRTERDAG